MANRLSSVGEEVSQPIDDILLKFEGNKFLEKNFMTNRIEGLAEIDKNTSDIGVRLQKPRNITEKN